MKIYISGKITGTDDYMQRFDIAETALIAQGHEVMNPAKVNANLPESTTHREYMEVSIAMLDQCDIIFVLKGWEDSRGVNCEIARAIEKGISIIFEERSI